MSSEVAPPPPTPPPPTSPQHQRDDDDLYGPVTKAASREAEREERRKGEELQNAHCTLDVQAQMNFETAQVMAAAAAASPPQQQQKRKKRLPQQQSEGAGGVVDSQLPPRPPQEKMSVAARARAAADSNNHNNNTFNNKNNNNKKKQPLSNSTSAPPSSGNRGVARGKFTAAQVKQLADAWGKDDTSDDDEYYYQDGDDDGSYYDDEGEDEPPYAGEEMFHYQHHRVSAYANRYGIGHVHSPPRNNPSHDGNHHHNNNNVDNNNNNNNSNRGGIFALASNWLQNQREKLHQLDLERQVEEQRRKLLEEGRKQREMEAERRRGGHHNQNHHGHNAISPSSSPSKNNSAVASSAIAGDDVAATSLVYLDSCVCNSEEETYQAESSPANFICGFGGNYSQPLDDASDYSGVARIDSSGNIVEMMPSRDFDDYDDDDDYQEEAAGEGVGHDFLTVRSPKITLTGKGMSVNVEIPDDNTSLDSSTHIEVKIAPEPSKDENSVAPFILLPPQMKALLESGGLPQSLNYCKWKRLYSLSRDGDSFETFLRLVEGHDRTVLVVKTTAGRLFGGYADTRWEARHKNRQADGFYGSAQACLFRFPRFGNTLLSAEEESSSELLIYKWTGANRYIQLCDAAKRAVAFGGGGDEGDFGLCIEDDFRRGTTGHCSTFGNEALCEEGYFDVVDLEVWGFTLDF